MPYIPTGGGGSGPQTPIPASQVTYDNYYSGLTATDVQGAMDELAARPPAQSRFYVEDGLKFSFIPVDNVDHTLEDSVSFAGSVSDNVSLVLS